MAIVWVRRQPGASVETGQNGLRTFRTTYMVKSDQPRELRTAILNCGLLPVYGSPHPEDLTAECVRVNPVQNRDNPYLWETQCEWTTRSGGRNEPDKQKPPDQRRPKWRHKFAEAQWVFSRDLDGKCFKDSAGTPFNPPPKIPIYVDRITVTRYESTLNRANDRAFLNSTNTDTWQNAAPGEALINDIDAEDIYEMGQWWFIKTYEVLVFPRITLPNGLGQVGGWDPHQVLDAGPKILAGTPEKPTPIVELGYVDGTARLLDGSGHLLASGADPVYLTFRTVNKKAFGPLNLVPPY